MLNNVATSSYWSSGAEQRSSYQRRSTAATGSAADTAAAATYRPTNGHSIHRKSQKKPQASAFFKTPHLEKISVSVDDTSRVCYI